MNKTELLNKLARDNGERLLLARALDKLELARQRNIPACTGFLSPQERVSVENLLNACGHPRHLFFGGYEGAERTVCAFLPDWQEAEDWQGDGESCPVRALRCTWSGGQKLTHRDFLGSILGLGLDREKVGDLLVGDGRCDVLALEEVADFLVFHMEQAGRVKLKCSPLPLDRLEPPAVETRTIRDTVSSLRLDAVAASGMKYFLFWVLCASLLDFALMGVDKWKARHNRWRVPERAFFCVALLGGTPGALLGMWTFRHKTRHWYFRYGLPALLLAQLALGTWIAIRVF